ncbi:hypothetical protein [Streptomyces cucumeris]|uniref:hypothetical protein n=1 Tax=Streptomyces cucumeris TaxID=2962890 RepID=UPI0020C8A020|nr:hypothetical protein [Streptomyces sp. NEAU-Y11]MCP9209297.1 hypothetical protein [Streptomyces sp. NEAU-Y11]
MKVTILIAIVAALIALVAAVLGVLSVRDQRREAARPSTWNDVAEVRKLALGVDKRTQWIAWLTLVNALVSAALALKA